jgi:hypothetical protein
MPPPAPETGGRRLKPFLHELYPSLTSFTNLLAAAKSAQRGKRFRPDVLAFNSRLEEELFQLQRELRGFSGRARGVQTRSRDPCPFGRDPHSAGGVAPGPGALASPAFPAASHGKGG